MIRIEQVTASVVWPVRHAVMYPDSSFDAIKLPMDDKGIHLALYEDEKLISVVSLFIENCGLQFRKFATFQEHQGKGYGSTLLQHVIDFASAEKVVKVWCNARRSAAAFYKKFGLDETEDSFSKNGIDYVIMELRLEKEPKD